MYFIWVTWGKLFFNYFILFFFDLIDKTISASESKVLISGGRKRPIEAEDDFIFTFLKEIITINDYISWVTQKMEPFDPLGVLFISSVIWWNRKLLNILLISKKKCIKCRSKSRKMPTTHIFLSPDSMRWLTGWIPKWFAKSQWSSLR